MEDFVYCVMCLETEVKMFYLNSAMLRIYRESISTDVQLSAKDLHACYECAYLLDKYGKFKTKCLKAHNILCSLSPEPFEVTKEKLNNIDRKQNKLESMLTVCTILNYYQCNHHNDYHGLDKKSNIEVVKSESVVTRIQEQYINDTLHSQEELPLCTADPTTFKNNVSDLCYLSNEKIKADVTSTPEYDMEDDNYTLDKLKKLNSNNNTNEDGFYVVSTNKDSDEETTDEADNKERKVSLLKVNCIDSNNHSDGHRIIVSRTTKRKHESINRNSIHSNNSKKKKSKKKVLIKGGPDDDIGNKHIKKQECQKTGKVNVKVKDKSNEGISFSINSSIFKEHMTVVQLTLEDAKSELLLRKESNNYKMNSYKCELCYRGFISKSTYQTHMKKHSSEYGTLKCDICQLNFTEPRYLANHRIVCHTRKFLCKICPYVCFGANQARAHIRSHKGKKYTCKECGEIFRFPNSLSTHVRLRHSVELVCDFCGSTFASPKGLDCHKRLLHRKEKNELLGPQCDECDVHFASELAWKRHRVLCSRHEVTDGCGVCGETFPDAGALRTHLREHGPLPTTWNARLRKKPPANTTGCTAPQPCSYCDKELRNKKEYKIHMASEHPDVDTRRAPQGFLTTPLVKWVCEVCGKMFKHHSLFISHQRKHTGEKPYSCPDCGKRFKRADAVKAHRPLHTNEYQFKCHLCDKAYGDRGKLNRHVKGHLGIRPYKCPYCDKSFLYQCVANAHTKYVHCKEPYPKRDRSKRTSKTKVK